LQLGLGAGAAAFALPRVAPRVGAQETGAADITGSFDWKRHDGTTIKALLNEHPYTTALLDQLETFSTLTGITVEYDTFPESNYFEKLTVDLQSGQPSYDVFMLGAYFVWQYGPPVPPRSTSRRASTISRRGCFAGRLPGFTAGTSGSRMAHWLSVRSVG
jgi:ABC-type glycerol-3-phosphate transport system substrate-binding protein